MTKFKTASKNKTENENEPSQMSITLINPYTPTVIQNTTEGGIYM